MKRSERNTLLILGLDCEMNDMVIPLLQTLECNKELRGFIWNDSRLYATFHPYN